MKRRLRAALRAGAALGGAVLFAFLLHRMGGDTLAASAERVGWRILPFLVPYGLAVVLAALPWRLLLAPEHRPTLPGTVLGRFAASAVNAVVPLMGLPGEPCRLLWLRRGAVTDGVAALVADRALFMLSGSCYLAVAVILAARVPGFPERYLALGAAAVGGSLLVALAIGLLAARGRIAARVAGWFHREHSGEEVDAALVTLLAARRGRLAAGWAVHLAGRVVLAGEFALALWALGVPASAPVVVMLSSIPVAVGVLASFVPSQIGLQEGALALVCGAVGLDPAAGIAVGLLVRIRQLVYVPLGFVLLSAARAGGARGGRAR